MDGSLRVKHTKKIQMLDKLHSENVIFRNDESHKKWLSKKLNWGPLQINRDHHTLPLNPLYAPILQAIQT